MPTVGVRLGKFSSVSSGSVQVEPWTTLVGNQFLWGMLLLWAMFASAMTSELLFVPSAPISSVQCLVGHFSTSGWPRNFSHGEWIFADSSALLLEAGLGLGSGLGSCRFDREKKVRSKVQQPVGYVVISVSYVIVRFFENNDYMYWSLDPPGLILASEDDFSWVPNPSSLFTGAPCKSSSVPVSYTLFPSQWSKILIDCLVIRRSQEWIWYTLVSIGENWV